MLDSQQIQIIRENICWLLSECNVARKVTPFDHDLYRECVDEAVRRGYAMEGDHSVQTFLRQGVVFASNVGRHFSQRATQRWLALYTSCAFYIDEAFFLFPSEIPQVYQFNDRLICGQRQENPVLDAFTDILQQTPDLFRPISSKLIVTSTLNSVTANLLESETTSMQISSAARQYQRRMSGISESYAYIAFSREIPVTEYVQAISEFMEFTNDVNDVMSFYKEELAGEITNRISTMAARDQETHLESFMKLAKSAVDHHRKVMKILEGSPVACDEIKQFCVGYIDFHLSLERYKLGDLNLY